MIENFFMENWTKGKIYIVKHFKFMGIAQNTIYRIYIFVWPDLASYQLATMLMKLEISLTSLKLTKPIELISIEKLSTQAFRFAEG